MGMVKRVLYTAPWGSCRDPEAVSYCRIFTGGSFCEHSIEDPYHDLLNILCLEQNERNSPDVSAPVLVFSRASIS